MKKGILVIHPVVIVAVPNPKDQCAFSQAFFLIPDLLAQRLLCVPHNKDNSVTDVQMNHPDLVTSFLFYFFLHSLVSRQPDQNNSVCDLQTTLAEAVATLDTDHQQQESLRNTFSIITSSVK